jgi:two-component system sensor histidine kinase VanS
MKNKNPSIFFKIFTYTMLLVLLICLTAVLLFSRQFLSFYRAEQVRQLSASFQPMLNAIAERGGTPEEMADLARRFAESNQSFRFQIHEENGKVLFTTGNFIDDPPPGSFQGIKIRLASVSRNQAPGNQNENTRNSFLLTGYGVQIDYGDLVFRSLLGVLIMLAIAALGAFVFARKITKPLEDEIIRERTIEENQRLFFSAASHELKTPIAAARALVEGMIANVGDYRDHGKYLRECMKTLDSQSQLVSEVLEIVKLSEKENAPVMAPLNLAELGNAVLAEHTPIAVQHGLKIEGEFPSVSVFAEKNLLRLALSNVIANAVQNTPPNGTIIIKAQGKKDLRLSIANTGAQIPEEVLSGLLLFEPFYRLDAARTAHNSHSGLGLAIVKKALDCMGFPFALENSGEGVVFWVDLPV